MMGRSFIMPRKRLGRGEDESCQVSVSTNQRACQCWIVGLGGWRFWMRWWWEVFRAVVVAARGASRVVRRDGESVGRRDLVIALRAGER